MDLKTSQTRHQRTWFGLNATVTVGPGFVHKAGVGKILIPHPPVINWLLRRGLSNRLAFKLTVSHEMGHFQTAPFIVLYAIAILANTFATGHFNIPQVLCVLVGIQAAWEMLSEMFAFMVNISYYRLCYKGIPKLPRITFWMTTGILTVGGWFIAYS